MLSSGWSLLVLLFPSLQVPLRCLGEHNSSEVSRTLLSILAELNNTLIWMVSNLFYYFQVFQSLLRVWLIASLLKSAELFSVFWPILIMQSSGWSQLVLLFPSLQVPLRSLGDGKTSEVSRTLLSILVSTRHFFYENN